MEILEADLLAQFIDALPDDIDVLDCREDDTVYHLHLCRGEIEVFVPVLKNSSIEKAMNTMNAMFQLYESSMQ